MSKIRKSLIALLSVLLCVMLSLGILFLIPGNGQTAQAFNNTTNYVSLVTRTTETGKYFDNDSMNALFAKITGKSNATYADVEAMFTTGSETYSAIDLYNNAGKSSYDVLLDNKYWNPVYLSKANKSKTDTSKGDIILTLWAAEVAEDMYNQGVLFTPFVSGLTNSGQTYTSEMYSASIVREYFMGIPYANSTSALHTVSSAYPSVVSDIWKQFREDYGDYMVAPNRVDWQRNERAINSLFSRANNKSVGYSFINEAAINNGESYSYNYGTQDSAYYYDWGNDSLWLPSITETGTSYSYDKHTHYWYGIWYPSNDLQYSSLVDSHLQHRKNAWLRTSGGYLADYTTENFFCYYTNKDGVQGETSFSKKSGNSYLVVSANDTGNYGARPAFHFNLTKAYKSIPVPDDVTVTYNGEVQNISTLTQKPDWYLNDLSLYNADKLTVEYVTADMRDANQDGYIVNVTLNDTTNFYWSDGDTSSNVRQFRFRVNRAPLNVNTLSVDENGDLEGEGSVSDLITQGYLSTGLYEWDNGKSTAPQFGLQYRNTGGGNWTADKPTVAGTYEVRAYLINDNSSCNYYIANDGGLATFVKPKRRVETPHFTQEDIDPNAIVGTVTTVQYSGDYQEFKLVNTTDNELVDVTVGERTGSGFSYDPSTKIFKAKAVGTYTVAAVLADNGDNTQWDSNSTETSRTITLIITEAELKVNNLQSETTSWTKGDIDYITIEVSGVRGREGVQLDVYYFKTTTPADKTYVADSAMVLNEEGDTIIVTVNLATFETTVEYQLYVTFRDDIAANKNYVLVNNDEPYKFTILTATIDDEKIEASWLISNIVTSVQTATNEMEVEFNGYQYTMSFNLGEFKGIDLDYGNTAAYTDVKTGGGYYVTKVTLKPQVGYQFKSNKTFLSFEISWKITPIEFDLADLEWADNPEYTGSTLTMTITNLPNWLTDSYYTVSGNTGRDVKSYTAIYTLYSTGNYVYTCSDKDNTEIVIGVDGTAVITHVWEITKKTINVTNAPKQWSSEVVEYSNGESNYTYLIYVPAESELGEYLRLNIIKITYWEDDKFTKSVTNIRQLEVDFEIETTYYIKIEISDDYTNTYKMYNTLNGADYAYTSFMVGGSKTIIELIYETSDELMYTGSPREVKARWQTLQFEYTYYELDEDGNETKLEDGAPTEIGNYKVVVSLTGEDLDYYWIQNSVFYFSIVPLELSTDGLKAAKGNALKEAKVIAEGVADTSIYFEYKVYTADGEPVNYPAEQLEYNTTYRVRLVIVDKYKNKVVWAKDAVTEYTFKTSFDPNAEKVELPDPAITVFDGKGLIVNDKTVVWTGETFTVTINNWDVIGQFVVVTLEGEDEPLEGGTYTFSNAGVYKLIISISEDALLADVASWLWGNPTEPKSVTFEITKRQVAIPKANGELYYNGKEQYLFPDGYDEDYIEIVSGSTLSATDMGGPWTVTLALKDKDNTCWADGTTDDKTFSWSIVEAKIGGEWKMNKSGYPEFNPNDNQFKDKITVTYYDEDGNVVDPEDFVDGQNYYAEVKVKDEYKNDYDFAPDVEKEYDFTYSDPGLNKISGKWVENDKGYAEFVTDNAVDAKRITVTYYDEYGDEVSIADMVEGELYTAKVTVKPNFADSYKLDSDVDDEYDFIYLGSTVTPGPGGDDDGKDDKNPNGSGSFTEWLNDNWWWLLIVLAVIVVLLIVLYIVGAIARRRREERRDERMMEMIMRSQQNNSAYPFMNQELPMGERPNIIFQLPQNENGQPLQLPPSFDKEELAEAIALAMQKMNGAQPQQAFSSPEGFSFDEGDGFSDIDGFYDDYDGGDGEIK